MLEKEKATAPTVAEKTTQTKAYHSELQRQAQIEKRRREIPKSYQGIYNKAVSGKSLRAAINSFCLECVCWQRKEITLCTALACPLYAVRPYQEILQNRRNGGGSSVESKNSGQ